MYLESKCHGRYSGVADMQNTAYQISKLDPCNQPCPNDAGGFAAEIARIGQEFNQPMRLVWQPDVMATLWGQKRRRYGLEKYGRCEHLRGWWIGEMKEVNGETLFAPRQKVRADRFAADPHAAFKLPNGDWVQSDLEENLVAEPRWIVEYKLHDREKIFHERERYDYERELHVEFETVMENGEPVLKKKVYEYENPFKKVDALGPYPKDGKWGRLFIVAQHWIRCCEEANAEHRICQGIGRPPNDYDLQAIRQTMQERETDAKLPEPGTAAWDHQMTEEIRKINDEIAVNKAGAARAYDEIFDRAIMPTLKRVYRRNNPDKAPTVGIHIPDGHPLLKGDS